ncbi:MAG: STAS domain-containing protein [Deltaproteobacteria bacterium]
MPIQVVAAQEDSPARITIHGAFDYSVSGDFRLALKELEGVERCVVDLEATSYVDSSALGMLLVLRDHVERVQISNCTGYAKRVFDIAGFEAIFDFD